MISMMMKFLFEKRIHMYHNFALDYLEQLILKIKILLKFCIFDPNLVTALHEKANIPK